MKLQNLEEALTKCAEKYDSDPNAKSLVELECLQTEYDSMYDYITQGAIIRSRATWYEFGERNNKYFFESGKLPIKRKAPCGKSSTGKEN